MDVNRAWLVSRWYDLTFFSGPALAAAVVAMALPPVSLGLVGWLVLVVAIDVGHTWVTLYRSYLDPATRRDHPGLLWGVPLLAFTCTTLVQSLAPGWFWTAMAYMAIFHFIRQQQGFAALYRASQGIPRGALEARVEHALVAALCLFPVTWWHAHLPRRFAWFVEGDLLTGLPTWVASAMGVFTLILAFVWLFVRTPAPGRDLWVLSTAATWMSGIVLTNGDAPFTIANVIAHGVPYFALVHHVGRRQWAEGEGAVHPRLFAPSWLAAFLAIPLAAAALEELAWDALVWREHLFPDLVEPSGAIGLVVSVLGALQLTHYLLDGALWKSSPALRARLGLLASGAPMR